MRLWVVLDLHGQASVLGVYDDPAVAHEVAASDPAYQLVEACELNARPPAAPVAPTAPRRRSSTPRAATASASEAPAMPPRPFTALEPRLSAVASASMASTMLATDFEGRAVDGARVLVRRLDADPYADDAIVARIAETIAISARVRHPAWAPPLALGVLGPDAALLWAWPAGATLEQWHRACDEPVSVDFAVSMLMPLLDAAQKMHDVHSAPLTICLHPSNVLVGADGRDQLLGAPLSPSLDGVFTERVGVLAIEGGAAWWGPELRDVAPHGPRATVHTAGVTLAWLLFDELPRLTPFMGQPERDALIETLRGSRPELPAGLLDVLRQAIHADPRARYATPAELARALAALRTSPTTAARQRSRGLARSASSAARPA